jgi:hypothetical protein
MPKKNKRRSSDGAVRKEKVRAKVEVSLTPHFTTISHHLTTPRTPPPRHSAALRTCRPPQYFLSLRRRLS